MKWIDQLIIGILDMYGTNDPYDILTQMEVEVMKVDKFHPMLQGKKCIYIVQFNAIYIIDGLIINHELFYLRHELGHILLHLNRANTTIINNGKIEREANYFAFMLSKITLDKVDLYEMTLEQICCSLELPYDAVNQLVNL